MEVIDLCDSDDEQPQPQPKAAAVRDDDVQVVEPPRPEYVDTAMADDDDVMVVGVTGTVRSRSSLLSRKEDKASQIHAQGAGQGAALREVCLSVVIELNRFPLLAPDRIERFPPHARRLRQLPLRDNAAQELLPAGVDVDKRFGRRQASHNRSSIYARSRDTLAPAACPPHAVLLLRL